MYLFEKSRFSLNLFPFPTALNYHNPTHYSPFLQFPNPPCQTLSGGHFQMASKSLQTSSIKFRRCTLLEPPPEFSLIDAHLRPISYSGGTDAAVRGWRFWRSKYIPTSLNSSYTLKILTPVAISSIRFSISSDHGG
jgi:hypothetical protein